MPAKCRRADHDPAYRPEIDGLRAVAVAAVVLYHFFDDLVPSGFVGVDVFFVISGFVITSHMQHVAKETRASFLVAFYARRMKRLLPALLLCVVITAIAFVSVVTRPPVEVFKTGAVALAGLSNIELWLLSQDYFSVDARLNPFTHTWSLGVEEQFYLVYPALFMLLGYSWHERRETPSRLARVIAFISAATLAGYVALVQFQPQAAFYLMPPRIWEFGAGALVFLTTLRAGVWRPQWVATVGATLLLACLFLPAVWQAAATMLAVAATAILLFGINPGQRVYAVLSSAPMVSLGRMSYSLYLWHGSVLVIGRWTIGTSLSASLVLLAVTWALAFLAYRLVEEPLRRAKWLRPNVVVLALGVAACVPLFKFVWQDLPALGAANNVTLPALLGVAPPGPFADVPCHGRAKVAALHDALHECLAPERTAERPKRITLLGESHAAQLYPMVKEAVAELPYAVAFINPEDYDEFPFGFFAGRMTSRILDYVTGHLAAGDVLIIAFHRGHLRLDQRRDRHVARGETVDENSRSVGFVTAMRPYIEHWSAKGARIVFVNDTPLMNVVASSAACMLQVRLFGESLCRVAREQDMRTRAMQDRTYARLAALSPAVFMWDPAPLMYGDSASLDVADHQGRYIMWDWNHISEYQSRLLAPAFRAFLIDRVQR